MTETWPVPREQTEVAAAVSGQARILVAGDLYPGGRPQASLSAGKAHAVWGALAPTFDAHDLCIADLEAPLTDRYAPIAKAGPNLRGAPDCVRGISQTFGMVTLANNHIMDMGAGGLKDTMEACRAVGLRTVGAGEDLNRAKAPAVVRVGDIQLAVVTAADSEFSIARSGVPGAAPIDAGELCRAVDDHSRRARHVVVLLHAGNEHFPLPSPTLQRVCRQVIEAGASCAICSHAHVSGGTEYWAGKPIVYGTGNFLFDSPAPRGIAWNIGQLVSLTLDSHSVVRLELIPYEQCLNGPVVKPLGGDLLAEYHRRCHCIDGIISDPEALEAEWWAFAARSRQYYLSALLQLTKVERGLLRLGVWPTWRLSRKQVYTLRNLFTCDAHREVVTHILDVETGREPDSCASRACHG